MKTGSKGEFWKEWFCVGVPPIPELLLHELIQ